MEPIVALIALLSVAFGLLLSMDSPSEKIRILGCSLFSFGLLSAIWMTLVLTLVPPSKIVTTEIHTITDENGISRQVFVYNNELHHVPGEGIYPEGEYIMEIADYRGWHYGFYISRGCDFNIVKKEDF